LSVGTGDVNAKKPPLAAWKLVTRPKMKGGSGIIRLILQNDALLMKNCTDSIPKASLSALGQADLVQALLK
jgi:hypothetical protein